MEKSDKEKKQFNELILTDEYISWLSKFMNEYNDIDDIYFIHNNRYFLNEKDLLMISYLEYLFKELNKFAIKNAMNYEDIFCYLLKHNDSVYMIQYNGEGYSCTKCEPNNPIINLKKIPCIEYKALKKQFGKNMHFNFEYLEKRVKEALTCTDLDKIRYELKKIQSPTLVSGVGGSSVVSEFTAKVLREKNKIIALNTEPRDFVYEGLNGFENVISCSYSGNNYGVELSFQNDLKHYLLSSNSFDNPNVTYLKYDTSLPKENSFISLGATLIPITVIANYLLDGANDKVIDFLQEKEFNFDPNCDCFEIFSGIETSTAAKYLESTMSESGIGLPIVHDKYAYCHGRSTLSVNYNNIAIYFNRNTELDKLLLEELKKYYKGIVVIDSQTDDKLLDDYQMLVQSMYLTKYVAEKKGKDLSKVDYCPIVKKLYKYNGKL